MGRDIPEDEDWEEKRTGGAGARRQPLSNREYRREIRKLERLNAADSDE